MDMENPAYSEFGVTTIIRDDKARTPSAKTLCISINLFGYKCIVMLLEI